MRRMSLSQIQNGAANLAGILDSKREMFNFGYGLLQNHSANRIKNMIMEYWLGKAGALRASLRYKLFQFHCSIIFPCDLCQIAFRTSMFLCIGTKWSDSNPELGLILLIVIQLYPFGSFVLNGLYRFAYSV